MGDQHSAPSQSIATVSDLLRAVNVGPDMKPAEIGRLARRAREHKEWLILMFHYLVDKPSQSLEYSLADFEKAVAEIAKSGTRVLTMTQVWEACGHEFAGPTPSPECDFSRAAVAKPAAP